MGRDRSSTHSVWRFLETELPIRSEDSVAVKTNRWLFCFSDILAFILISNLGFLCLKSIGIHATSLCIKFVEICRQKRSHLFEGIKDSTQNQVCFSQTDLCSLTLKSNKEPSPQRNLCSLNSTLPFCFLHPTVGNNLLPLSQRLFWIPLLWRLPLVLSKFTMTVYAEPCCSMNVKWTPSTQICEPLFPSWLGYRQVFEAWEGWALLEEVISGVWHWCFITWTSCLFPSWPRYVEERSPTCTHPLCKATCCHAFLSTEDSISSKMQGKINPSFFQCFWPGIWLQS